jgi:TonB family protein
MPDLRLNLFEQTALVPAWRPPRPLAVSIAVHLVLFGLLLRGRSAIFVAPSSTLAGAHGTTITHIYWAASNPDSPGDTETRSPEKRHAAHKPPLVWTSKLRAEMAAEKPETPAAAPAPSAGSPYGSMPSDAAEGAEVRPALPARTFEPRVSPEYLHGITEGNVVVEITIDETGKIVSKTVMQSMGPALDSTVLAALENWFFHPATRDGVPIPSRQDVVYHFKPI